MNGPLESFVLAILSIPWADQERPVVTAYKHFLTNLISAQSYYTKPVVKMLLTSMLGIKELKVNNIMNSFLISYVVITVVEFYSDGHKSPLIFT